MDDRPDIETISSGHELRRWYWRKDELVAHARQLGLKTNAAKFTVLDRIAHFLDTGETDVPGDMLRRPKSKFDWHSEELRLTTVITDSYKNSQNVRRFFKSELGPSFSFNIPFMEWMKGNVGKTLKDACEAYREIQAAKKDPDFKSEIKSHNQFNQYTRDFLADNPDLNMSDVRRVWALKIKLPSSDGRHVYDRSDLDL